MWLVLLLIFFFIFIYPLLRVRSQVNQVRREFEKTYNQSCKNANNGQTEPTKKRKVFTEKDGEYVNFEEIKGEHLPQSDVGTTYTESQVSDAEFEEVKGNDNN